MIVTRLRIPLDKAEYSALQKLADIELRSLADQARILLRFELERRGLLETEPFPSTHPSSDNPLEERIPQGETLVQGVNDVDE